MKMRHLSTTRLSALDQTSQEAVSHYYDCLLNDAKMCGVRETAQAVIIVRGGALSIPERFWTHRCCRCERRGSVVPNRGSWSMSIPISWKCRGCGQYVCHNCTLTVPGSAPLRFREDTLCSVECWEKIGAPREEEEEEDRGSGLGARGTEHHP